MLIIILIVMMLIIMVITANSKERTTGDTEGNVSYVDSDRFNYCDSSDGDCGGDGGDCGCD